MHSASVASAAERGKQPGIHNSKAIVLGKECVLVCDSDLDVVNALDVRHVRANAGVGQEPELRDGFVLKRPEVGERIVARIIVILVVPHEGAQVNTAFGIQ